MGWDYSGTIVAVGDKLKGKWEVGDEVWGICDGPVGGTFFTFKLQSLGVCRLIGIGCPRDIHSIPYRIG